MTVFPLMQIVVDSALFFGLSGDDVVNPDAAVEQLEGMASQLKLLSDPEKQDLLAYFRKIAEQEASKSGNTPSVDFLLSLGENLDLC